MKLKILGFLLLVALSFYGYWLWRPQTISTVAIGNQIVKVTVASNQQDLSKGLAGVKQLDWNQGMLFIFPKPSLYQFWMKDMLIPIDIIWLNGNQIVDITANVQPPADLANQTNLPLYNAKQTADTVLEVKAGFAEKYQVKIGDTVTLR